MKEKEQRFINELSKEANLSAHTEKIQKIISVLNETKSKYWENYCKIRCDDLCEHSEFDGEIGFIVVCTNKKILTDRKDPLDTIWGVLHEFGHYLSPKITSDDHDFLEKKITREQLAWDNAKEIADQYSFFDNEKESDSFEKYRDYCIKDYKDNYKGK